MNERDPLVDHSNDNNTDVRSGQSKDDLGSIFCSSKQWLLPLSFITAFACTITSATSVFVFAKLLCRDPLDCDRPDAVKFAKSIAIATSCANVVGALALLPLERLSRIGQRYGLLAWLSIRSLSPICLLLGLSFNSVTVALCSKIFESAASDNVFHFNQNAAFSLAGSRLMCNRLIAASLGLYMIGVSISPFVGGVLHDILKSFVASIALFAIAFVYVFGVVSNRQQQPPATVPDSTAETQVPSALPSLFQLLKRARQAVLEVSAPIIGNRKSLIVGLSLFTYNLGQCYAFESILVSNTLRFRFGPFENGIVISSAHIAATVLLLGLSISSRKGEARLPDDEGQSISLWERLQRQILGIISLVAYGLVLIWIGFAVTPVQIYTGSILIAVGLSASYLLKSHLIASVPREDGPSAAAFAAGMEILASTLAPISIGYLQALWDPQKSLTLLGGAMFISGGVLMTSIF